ncbi:MAG: VOC family protein [Chloroflexota bacterium]
MARKVQVVIDCHDPATLAPFWAEALGYQLDPPPAGFANWQDWLRDRGVPPEEWNAASAVSDPEGAGPRVYFQRVPEDKVVKNRVHLDINVGGGRTAPLAERRQRVDAEAQRLTALGARVFRAFEEQGEYWVTLLDPEGNEFDLQ